MSLTYQRLHISQTIVLLTIISLLISCKPIYSASAEEVPNTSNKCVDVALVFARGSGQNNSHELIYDPLNVRFSPKEKESYTFFKNHADYFKNYFPNISYKAVSVHDFPGKYDPVGYQAVSVGWDTPEKLGNSANADVSWIPGDYQASVQHGIAETVGYLKDQIATCPNQYFIIGGYSQGAQVMGESMFQLTSDERSKILGVGLFGDPKYIGAKDAVSFPWRRGEATSRDTGMLDPRVPYVPQGMERRTLSWCNRSDIVCAGWSALRRSSSHSAYSENSIGYAVKELVSIATPQLTALDRNTEASNIPPVQVSPEDLERHRDVMFVLNDNSNTDVLNTFRYYLDPTLPQFANGFMGTRFAAKSFGEHDYGFSAPRVDNIQSFLPLMGFNPSNPTFSASNLKQSFVNKYPFGQPIVGGGDIADPHQLALERAITSSGWSEDPGVERNIVLITDRPPKDPYEYNICNSTVRQWLHFPDIDGYKNCYTNYHREIWQKVLEPETCEKITMVILEDTCTNPLMAPYYVQMNKRSLEDEIKLAQAYNVKISVIIPHKFDPAIHAGNTLTDPKVRDKLRYLAETTGGKYIYYDNTLQYNATLLYDTLWQVFTKKPHSMDVFADGTSDKQVLGVQMGAPMVLDVSRNGIVAQSYRWDFDDDGSWDEITESPVIEHSFSTPGIFKVQAIGLNGALLSETRQIYAVTANQVQTVEPPALPENLAAKQQVDGRTQLTWSPKETGELLVVDPETNLPLGSLSLADGTLAIPSIYNSLEVRVLGEESTSEALTVSVEAYIPLSPEIPEPEVIEQPTPIEEIQEEEAPATVIIPEQPPVPVTTEILPVSTDPIDPLEVITPPENEPVTVVTSLEEANQESTQQELPTKTKDDETPCYKLQQCNTEYVPEVKAVVHQASSDTSVQIATTPAVANQISVPPALSNETQAVAGIATARDQEPVFAGSPAITPLVRKGHTKNLLALILIIIGLLLATRLVYKKFKTGNP